MVPGTESSEIVKGYPQTAANYPKAVEALKKRFGREQLLIQFYVRELLLLSFQNLSSKEKMPLRKWLNMYQSHLRSLESLNLSATDPSTFLFPLVESGLPEETRRAWQRSPLSQLDGSKENPPKTTLELLMDFVEREAEAEVNIELSNGLRSLNPNEKKPTSESRFGSNKNQSQKYWKEKSEVPTAAGLFSGQSSSCVFCDKNHPSQECFGARKMSLEEKKQKVNSKRACFTCLKTGHPAIKCKASVSCAYCNRNHHFVMCPDPGKKTEVKSTPTTQANFCSSGVTLLPTLLAEIVHDGRRKVIRVLCDSGAQHSYIKRSTAEELTLTPTGTVKYKHEIFGERDYVETHQKYVVNLKRLGPDAYGGAKFEVLCQERICKGIPMVQKGPWIKELKRKKIWLSDYGEGVGQDIEILVGNEVFMKILTGQNYRLKNGLLALETTLGWIVSGREENPEESTAKTLIAMHVSSSELPISKLWDLDTIGIMDPVEHKTKQEVEEETKKHFLKSVTRTEDGRYSVKLPWIEGAPEIPDNRVIAEKRLISATRKLRENGQFQVYDEMFKSWLQEGIIEHVNPGVTGGHFIPNRPVFKPGSATTPVRPVFDASCKTKGTGPSLNDCLQKGPNLMELIPSILLRFREKKIGVISDIRKAFLMVGVEEEDRNFLKFLWWEGSAQDKIVEYRHRRVVFGVSSSPFLLAAVLEHHLKNVDPQDREAALKLWKSLYVDNCVTSVSKIQDYEDFREVSTRVLDEAKMELRCWEWGTLGQSDSSAPVSSVLGLNWNKCKDTLSIDLEVPQIPEKISKRSILSAVHRVYDPIGSTAPVLLLPKLILQEVWAQDVSWDEQLSEEVVTRVSEWINELEILKEMAIPRHFNPYDAEDKDLSLHTFCDASQDAYAAVVFVRAHSSLGISVRLLQVKARVSPLKRTKSKEGVKTERRLTIPRLELLAATIGARVAQSSKAAMDWTDIPTFYWSDSSTVIAWLRRNEDWGTFVGNRVREVLKLTNVEDWNHVPGKLNPADLPSRGCTAAQLLQSRWWEGPEWLYKPKELWPVNLNVEVNEAEVADEKKKSSQVLVVNFMPAGFVPRFSTYMKNVRVMGWVLRFTENVRMPKGKRNLKPFLSLEELLVAEMKVLKTVQKEVFPIGAKDLTRLKVVEESGLLRVKTKLTNRIDTVDFRNPVILPKDHVIVTQLIQYVHKACCHGGTQIVINTLREKYWILQNRRAVSKVIRNCVRCDRYTVKPLTVEPAPLPSFRVEATEVYQNSGVDLAGPLFLNDRTKCWIVLFTCAVYRAVHLDIVTSLSTEAFIACLERFINYNGRPEVMYSDNGTNFVGAANLFQKVDWKKVEMACRVKQIKWIFNPPAAAWWGGWWERLIRSVKELLRKMLGRAKLSFDELRTCLSAVEATMNSRPLTTVTEDADDLIPLTPMMFTRTLLLPKFPEAENITSQVLQKRFVKVQELKKDLQARFRKEYLSLLVQKTSERKTKPPEVGDVVLVGSDDKKRFEWPMGRIVELLPGKDSHARTAKVVVQVKPSGPQRNKTNLKEKFVYKTQILIRPLQRLYPLEVRNSEEEPQMKMVKSREEKSFLSDVEPEINHEEDLGMEKTNDQEVITRFGRKIVRPRRFGKWQYQ